MSFYNLTFFAFLALTLTAYHLIPKAHTFAKKVLIIFANFIFYFSLNTALPFILLFSILLDYSLFQEFKKRKQRKVLLFLGIFLNLLPLTLIKFANDFSLWPNFINEMKFATDLAIPIGISFYTFKSISCLIDNYKNPEESPENIIDYMMYLSFFPELLCGPISRYSSFRHNLQCPTPTTQNICDGIIMISRGLFYKVIIANSFLELLNSGIHNSNKTIFDSLILGYMTVIQVYFDFSGYTEIARGTALFFGMSAPENFRFSFLTTNLADFWRRHHISMSAWFRDYVFIPLSFHLKNHKRAFIITITTLITFILSGIWHRFTRGAFIFGLTQGLSLTVYTLFLPKIRTILQRYKVIVDTVGWIIISLIQSISFSYLLLTPQQAKKLFSFSLSFGLSESMRTPLIAIIIILIFSKAITLKDGNYRKWWRQDWGLLTAGIMFTSVLIFKGRDLPFIYYQF